MRNNDSVHLVSQTKSLAQATVGDIDEACETQQNIVRGRPRFFNMTHMVIDDTERGEEIMELASWAPWPIELIKPKLHAFRNKKPSVTISYDLRPTDAIYNLRELLLGSERVIFITHGFKSNFEKNKDHWLHPMKNAMSNKKNQTIIIVSWDGGADTPIFNYGQAAANTKSVGEWLAGYARKINDDYPNAKIWGVGHSLGAHLMGQAGRESKVFTRITGLDPAGPSFENTNFGDNRNKCLRKDDAQSIVDVIHTNGYDVGVSICQVNEVRTTGLVVNHYGTLIPLGTVDFYPNFGNSQPGCKNCPGMFYIGACEECHFRSVDMFIWSISNPGKFKTNLILDGSPDYNKPVDRYKSVQYFSEMGYYADTSEFPNGNYYLRTNSSKPWI